MDLRQLEALVATLEEGSISAACERLGVSAPTLRGRLDRLEEDLGVTLLRRTYRGVDPTEAGARFLPRAKGLLLDMETLRRDTRRQDQETLGELFIVLPAGGLPPIAAPILLRQLRMSHPGLCLRFSSTRWPLRDAGPDADLVLTFEELPEDAPFRTFALTRFSIVLLASRCYLDERGRPETPEDLHGHDLLCWDGVGGDGTRWPLRAGGRIEVQPIVLSTDVLNLRTLAAAVLGIALIPDAPLARGTIPGEDFEVVLPEQIGREGVLRVLVREEVASSARTALLLARLRELVRGAFGLLDGDLLL
ncbi:MAG: LysR family transcriptional regulator [Alphaproteobacteria bacterium]|nr:LysR family transcriptional regulator [Alphaproteobacteria bacterium]